MVYAGGSSPPPLIRAPDMSTHLYCPPASSLLYALPTGRFTILVSVRIW